MKSTFLKSDFNLVQLILSTSDIIPRNFKMYLIIDGENCSDHLSKVSSSAFLSFVHSCVFCSYNCGIYLV